jgi:thiol-disulfide isomerase/thioredoxin
MNKMNKNVLNFLITKKILHIVFVLSIVLIVGVLYYFITAKNDSNARVTTSPPPIYVPNMSDPDMPDIPEMPDMPEMPPIIEGFDNSNFGYNQSKMIVIYTATWCPHCRSFMGMKDKDSPISEDSEFAKTKRELGNCFEHVKDTDENSGARMQKHGINGYPGIAFVDKNSDVGVPLGNVKRKSEDICAKFKALSS